MPLATVRVVGWKVAARMQNVLSGHVGGGGGGGGGGETIPPDPPLLPQAMDTESIAITTNELNFFIGFPCGLAAESRPSLSEAYGQSQKDGMPFAVQDLPFAETKDDCGLRTAKKLRTAEDKKSAVTPQFAVRSRLSHRRFLGRRREHSIQSHVVRKLTVVVRPVRRRRKDEGGARHFRSTEERHLLAELRIIESGKRLIAESERILQSGDEGSFA